MNNTENNTRLIVCITVLIILATLILDRLIPEGIFLDGVTYASISRNLAIGKGSFWALYYRDEWIFSEHPPLMFGIQALFFKLLGDHYLTEKIYSFFIWLITAICIRYLWNKTVPGGNVKYSFALPLLLWCIIPTVTWGYTNNILDTTMCMFDLLAAICIYRAISAGKAKGIILFITGSLFISCALLTKGPVGAFPLAIPFIYWLVYHNRNAKQFLAAFGQTIILLLVIVVCFWTLFQFPDSKANLQRYLNEQLFSALSGNREITGGGLGRLSLIYELLIQLLPAIVLSIVLIVIGKVSKTTVSTEQRIKKAALLFLLIGISGSLPILLSVKQRSFYLIPSLPYYILAISAMLYPLYITVTNKKQAGIKSLKYFKISTGVACVALLIYLGSKIGQPGRDKELISDIKYLGTVFPKNQQIGICFEAEKNYEFLAYLQRYNQMEVSHTFYNAEYVLVDKTVCAGEFTNTVKQIGFRQQDLALERYELYKRQFPLHFDFILLNPVFRKADK